MNCEPDYGVLYFLNVTGIAVDHMKYGIQFNSILYTKALLYTSVFSVGLKPNGKANGISSVSHHYLALTPKSTFQKSCFSSLVPTALRVTFSTI